MTMKMHNPRVPDVVRAFERVRRRGHYLAAWDGGAFRGDRYTARLSNRIGYNNHFQGMVRLGRYVVLSGGDSESRAAELYVTRMESRTADLPFRSNLWRSLQPPPKDMVARRVEVDAKMWHAGGIDASGDLLAVPLEGVRGRSRVVFYDFSEPEAPVLIPGATIDRAVSRASAAAVTQLADGRVLVAVHSYQTTRWLDFYLSHGPDVARGFSGPYGLKLRAAFGEVDYQAIHFVAQGDGRLFLVGFNNTSGFAPMVPGRDIVHLWEVLLPRSGPRAGRWPGLAVEQRDTAHFTCEDRQANMDAGAATWVDPAGGLHFYSCYHWRQDEMIRFSEFRAQPDAGGVCITEPAQAWIDLFEHQDYGGHCLSLVGLDESDIPDYAQIHVEGSSFNDVVSSVRFRLPPRHRYRLFEHAAYKGRSLDLVGDGRVVEIPDLRRVRGALRGDHVSSSRWIHPRR